MKKLLRVPNQTGDAEFRFDTAQEDEAMRLAKEAFDKARGQGALVVAVEAGKAGGTAVKNFNELAEENVVVRPLVAG